MKKKRFAKGVCAALMLTLAAGLCACGDKETQTGSKGGNADSSLAKQHVYAYQDIDIPNMEMSDMSGNTSIQALSQHEGRVYMVAQTTMWEETGTVNELSLISIKPDGTDIQSVELQGVSTEEEEKGSSDGQEGSGNEDTTDTTDTDADNEDPVNKPLVQPRAGINTLEADIAVENAGTEEDTTEDTGEETTEDVVDAPADNGEVPPVEYDSYSYFSVTDKVYAINVHTLEDYSDPENYRYETDYAVCAWGLDGSLLWEIPLEEMNAEGGNRWIQNMVVFRDGTISLLTSDDTNSFYRLELDAEGNPSPLQALPNVAEMMSKGCDMVFDTQKEKLILTYYDDNWTHMFMREYDLKTDALGEEKQLPDTLMTSGYNSMSFGSNGELMYVSGNGLYRYAEGAEAPEKVMDFINSDLNTSNMNDIVVLNETQFVAVYYDNMDGSQKVAIFTKRNPEDIPDKKVLVLAGQWIGYDLKNRVIAYNRENETYRVVIKEYSTYNTSEDYSAGVTQLNNDIISGNMPDVLIVDDSLPMETYISKGLLEDIGKLIEQDEELSKKEFMENVFEAYKVDGKLYYVIPSFNVRSVIGKTALLGDRTTWTMKEFQEFVKSMPEGTQAFAELTRDQFLYMMLSYCGSEFVDVSSGTCNFESEEFISMLEFAKSLPMVLEDNYSDENYWEEYQSQYREDRTALMEVYINSFNDMARNINGYFGEEINYIGFPTGSGEGSVIQANERYAISAKSGNQEGAWDFVRYYLTDEYQKTQSWILPISKDIFIERSKEGMQKPFYLDENGEKVEYDEYMDINGESIVIEPLNQEQVDQLVELITSAKKRIYNNEDIRNIITEEAAAFFEGQKSAKGVAQIIQSRAQIFVDENR